MQHQEDSDLDNMGATHKKNCELSTEMNNNGQKMEGDRFRILNLDVNIDKKPTSIDESSPTVLKYKTPHFRASATVQVPPLRKGEKWQVGWIQACCYMKFINTYGDEGCSSWEFPELTSGRYKMISDSDGRHYPWYGNKGVVASLQGPTKAYQTVSVGMTDNFYPHITWVIPIEGERKPKLNHIVRNQTFYTWLVARNIETDTYYILKTTSWTFWLEISVNPTRPLGQRSRLLPPWEQQDPIVYETNIPIQPNAMFPPNANSAQILVWRPRQGSPKIIIPPKWRASNIESRKSSSTASKGSKRNRQASAAVSKYRPPKSITKIRHHIEGALEQLMDTGENIPMDIYFDLEDLSSDSDSAYARSSPCRNSAW